MRLDSVNMLALYICAQRGKPLFLQKKHARMTTTSALAAMLSINRLLTGKRTGSFNISSVTEAYLGFFFVLS